MADSLMAKLAALEAATLPAGLVGDATAAATALRAQLDAISTQVIDFQEVVHRVLGDHPARHELAAPAEEARGWTWEARDYVDAVLADLQLVPALLAAALQRRDALLVTLRGG